MRTILALALATGALAQTAIPAILPMRERAELRDRWLERRLDTVVPALMREHGIDLWLLVAREYNEDPVVKTMLPATWLNARRRTVLVFHDRGDDAGGVERLAVARYDIGRFFKRSWDKEEQPDQYARIAELVRERDPKRIAVNVSRTFALADGMSASESEQLRSALGEELAARIVPGEPLAIGWLETRIPEEMAVYPRICAIAHAIIAEGLSGAVIQPGHTTTADVQWYYRERIRELKLSTWFHPYCEIQRFDEDGHSGSFQSKPGVRTILHGDLVHIDFGITYLGLNTDTQQHAYVLRPDEDKAPAGLVRAFAIGNRLQDILTENFVSGRTGNEILAATREQALRENIEPSIYTHPLGTHGHGAGPTIGLWDQQGGVPGRGDYRLRPSTVHSIELNAAVKIPEWGGKKVRIMLEEDAFFDGVQVSYLNGRQTALHLIRP